jgi:hypothetical protein
MPVSDSQSARCHPTARAVSAPFSTRSSVGTVSMPWCHEARSSVSSVTATPGGNAGSSWLRTVSAVREASRASAGATS